MKFTKFAVILLLAVIAAFGGAALRVRSFVDPEPQTIKDSISFIEESGSVNILLVGIDNVDGGRRADAIAFTSVDIDNKVVRLMSIPRDTRVQIPGRGWDKIGHAYAYGSLPLLLETVVNYLGQPINYYVLVNYDSFPSVINLLGGIEIDVERRMVYNDYAGKLFINIPKGRQVLDGKNALHYVRFRHDALGDIGRVERQQQFVQAVLKKVQSPAMIPKIPELVQKAIEMVQSDMTPAQALQLASYLRDLPPENMVFFTLPGKAAYISNLSYWIGDITAASQLLATVPETKESVASDDLQAVQPAPEKLDVQALVSSMTVPVMILNGSGAPGIGKQAATALQKIGVDVSRTGNAKHFDYRTTTIQVPETATDALMEEARTLGAIVGVDRRLITRRAGVTATTIILGKDMEKVLKRLDQLAAN